MFDDNGDDPGGGFPVPAVQFTNIALPAGDASIGIHDENVLREIKLPGSVGQHSLPSSPREKADKVQ